MNNKAVKYLFIGQVGLFFFLIICILLMPHFLLSSNEGGISNFALHARTIPAFTLSTVIGAGFSVAASFYIPNGTASSSKLRLMIRFWAVLALLSLISAYFYKINHVYNDLHAGVSTLLLILEVSFGYWLAFALVRDRFNFSVFAVQIMGIVLGILNFYEIFHVLFIVEVLEGLAFAVILVRSVKKLLETS